MASYVLSTRARQVLSLVTGDYVRAREGNESRNQGDYSESPAPETYVALVPQYGIAAYEPDTGTGTGTGTAGNVPYADCPIYRLDPATKQLIQTRTVRRVHNLSAVDIEEDTYILTMRDKYGYWWAVGVGVGSGAAGNTTTVVTGTRRELHCDPTGTGATHTEIREVERVDCIDGILYKTTYTKQITWTYVDGCMTVDEVDLGEVTEELGCCDCPETGTGTSECDCECCPEGVWDDFVLNASGIVPILFPVNCADCSRFDGLYHLIYRGIMNGKCVWTSNETIDDDCLGPSGEGPMDAFNDYTTAMWKLELFPNGGDCTWSLRGRFGTVAWFANMVNSSVGNVVTLDPQPTFCEEGGTLTRILVDIGENVCTGPTTLTLVPLGSYLECPTA